MSKEANNDIDILLRKLSRQDGAVLNSAEDAEHLKQGHLDADELNAYAENALPSALRTHYTDHLTECTSCRKTVTQLSLAAAVVVREKVEETKPSALKTFFAAMFSPLVFRYAVPAMAIVVVVAIAWVAVQRLSPSSRLAQQMPGQPQPPVTQNETTNSPSAVAQSKADVNEAKESQAPQKATAPEAPLNKQEVVAEEEQRKLQTDDLRARGDLAKQNQPAAAAPVGAGATESTVAATPQPASPKSDVVAERSEVAQKKEGEGQKREAEADKNKVMNEPPAREPAPPSDRSAKSLEVASASKSASPGPGAATTGATRRALRERDAKDEEAGEVRTVGGHRFRKRGDVWVDSLYASQTITNVSRGSEQYRALVSDEPGIRAIAEELKGELIVVWIGRAYRIR